jgi:transcription elongation GreA/GreB family factor
MSRKPTLRQELIAALTAALDTARAAHAAAVEGATHSEARAENDKDTRGLEQSYLARGQAQRVEELTMALAATEAMLWRRFAAGDPVEVSALVTVEEDGKAQLLLVAPHGGGVVLSGNIQVVTPRSPLGQALAGRVVGDEIEVRLPGAIRELEITAIE